MKTKEIICCLYVSINDNKNEKGREAQMMPILEKYVALLWLPIYNSFV